MKALLISINAKFIHTNNAVRLLKANSDFQCDICEYTIKDSYTDIIQDIEQSDHDVVGFSVYIWNVEIIKTILSKLSTNKIIVLGGPEVSYEPEHFLRSTPASYIVKGEGEVAFNELLTALNNGNKSPNISNLSYISDDSFVHTPIQEIRDLSTLKSPYYDTSDRPHIPHKIAYIESSRGCPYNCAYCLSSLEKTVRFFDIKTVTNAIDYYVENGAKTIKFLDRTFNANKKTLEIIDHIIKHDNRTTTFQFEITGDTLSPAIIEKIHKEARKGLFRFEIGVQSTNPLTNELVDRKQNTQKLIDIIESIIKHDIITLHLDLIAGLPKEDKTSFINTFNTIYKCGAKELQLGFLKLLRGTKLKYQANYYGITYHDTAPYEIIETDVLSKQDITEIHLVEHMLEIYHNKGYFGKQLKQIILNKPSPYHFFLTLGKAYQKNNYSLHRYQLEDVYYRLFEHLSSKEQFLVKQDYLLRSTIKPKKLWQAKIDKTKRKTLLNDISTQHCIPIRDLYKHTRIIQYKNTYFIVYYKASNPQHFTINY